MRIAIIGGGISGLTAGYRLHRDHEVTLFEAAGYAGGHTNTVMVETPDGPLAVDTGFIVFNDRTYPNFINLLHELDVAYQPTTMSFSVCCEATGLEYSGTGFNGLFAQRRNLVRPSFHRMLFDFYRFKQLAEAMLVDNAPPESVADFLVRHRFSKSFVEQYFLPMGAAIWSSSFDRFREFPIQFIAEFYRNHGLLGIHDRPQWYVIQGGSKQYVKPLTHDWQDRIRLNSAVRHVARTESGVAIDLADGSGDRFDHVIFACHSDQALRILGDGATSIERDILSAFPYQSNQAVLHTQTSLLPKNHRAWACWNYFNPKGESNAATLTYNMNMLQSLDSKRVYCVTLNDTGRIRSENVIQSFQYAHPTFGIDRKAMQARHGELINHHSTSFCGAYWGNGFHEDGVNSALAVTSRIQEAACVN